jgi:WD40 repeat protein
LDSASAIEHHPILNFFAVGSSNQLAHKISVNLYQYELEQELISFNAPSDGHLTKCRFDPYGAKIASSDSKGDLFFWRIDVIPTLTDPCITLKGCHQSISDFHFLNSSSIIATSGHSASHGNVSIWDTLMPLDKARVQTYQTGDYHINSLVHTNKDNLLIAGGKRGMLYMIDVRKSNKILNAMKTHETSSISSLVVDSDHNKLYSGYSTGEIKIWDILSLATGIGSADTFTATESKPYSDGIIQLNFAKDELISLYSSGALYRTSFK